MRYDLDVQNTVLDLVRSMCFHTGGVLRLKGIGPGLVTSQPASVVSQSYEAGVVDLRFIRSGTATVDHPAERADAHHHGGCGQLAHRSCNPASSVSTKVDAVFAGGATWTYTSPESPGPMPAASTTRARPSAHSV